MYILYPQLHAAQMRWYKLGYQDIEPEAALTMISQIPLHKILLATFLNPISTPPSGFPLSSKTLNCRQMN